jgi:hypothetical protein
MKRMTKKERINRIIVRGEISNHVHIIVGDAVVNRNDKGEILIEVGNEGAVLRHLLETEWMQGKEVWTKEHTDISIEKGSYRYIPQIEWHPYSDLTKPVKD